MIIIVAAHSHCILYIEGMGEGKRKRGRQKKLWFDNIRERTGLSHIRAKCSAQNRSAWRRMIKKCAVFVGNARITASVCCVNRIALSFASVSHDRVSFLTTLLISQCSADNKIKISSSRWWRFQLATSPINRKAFQCEIR